MTSTKTDDPCQVPGSPEAAAAAATAFVDPRGEVTPQHPLVRPVAWRVAALRARALPVLLDRKAALTPADCCVRDPLERWSRPYDPSAAPAECLSCGSTSDGSVHRCWACCVAFRVVCAEADRLLLGPQVVVLDDLSVDELGL